MDSGSSRNDRPPLKIKERGTAGMIRITVEDAGVRALLRKLKHRAGDMSPVMRQIAGIMHHAVEENFARQGRPKWQDLAPSTKKARARKGHWPGKILQVKGQLAASISEKHNAKSAVVGTNKKYAAIHQFGGDVNHPARERILHFKKLKSGRQQFAKAKKATWGRKAQGRAYKIHIPARPFLKLTDGDLNEIKEAIERYLIQ
jgi:phage virion morphogenesis protein